METVNVTVRMERQTRDGAAKLFSELGISTTQAINMFLKQAVREQGIPLRGHRKAHRRSRQGEHGKVSTPPIASAAAALLRLGQPPSQGCILSICQKYSRYAILSARPKSTTYDSGKEVDEWTLVGLLAH